MPRNKVDFVIAKDDVLMQAIEQAGKDLQEVTEKALKSCKQYVNSQLAKDSVKPNYPHQGKYSDGTLKNSIDNNFSVEWEGMKAGINIGYDFSKSGMESIIILHGAPNRDPSIEAVKKLYDDIYGKRHQKKCLEIQEETILKILQR